MTDPRHTYAYQKLRAAWLTAHRPDPCALCGRPIEYGGRSRNPRGPSVDHSLAVDHAPHAALDPSLWRMAHLSCNSAAGARQVNAKRRGQQVTGPPPGPYTASREW